MHVGLVDLKWRGHHTPYVIYLSRYFTEQGHDVTFITDEEHPRLDELPNSANLNVRTANFSETEKNPRSSLAASLHEQWIRVRQLRRIFRMANGADVDVLHFLYFDRTQVPLWIASTLVRESLPPIVTTLHRDAFTDTEETNISKQATQAVTIRALDSSLTEGTIRFLTVHAKSIQERIIDSVDAATKENTVVIPAPTPELSVNVTQKQAREYLDLPTEIPILLFFGELRYEKGPDLLAEAMQTVDRPAVVVFAGSEADFTQKDIDRWKEQIHEPVTVIDHIKFIPEQDVDYYFTAADALVLPYRRQRGISLPLGTACMAGTPIIGNRESDIGETIERNNLGTTFRSGSVFDLTTRIEELVSQRNQQNDELRAFAESRHWRKTGEMLEELYRMAESTKTSSA